MNNFRVCAILLINLALPDAVHASQTDGVTYGLSYKTPVLHSGVTGNSLCLTASDAKDGDTYAHIEKVFGKGAVEAPSDDMYVPPRPHVSIGRNDALVGDYFSIMANEMADVNLDKKSRQQGSDRSRTEIKIAPSKGGMHETFKARDNDVFNYRWQFRVAAQMKFSPSFTHIHQIKAYGGSYAEPPLITFTVLNDGKLYVRHIADKLTEGGHFSILGSFDLAALTGQWLDVREEIHYSNTDARYQLLIRDQQGRPVLNIDRSGLSFWRTGADHMRPKWGIYRKHHPDLRQDAEDLVDFANLAITRGGDGGGAYCGVTEQSGIPAQK
ncbi:heparin lyase I family protein [Undibacterium sp. Di26W]|uniref:heparin lyase I family protein n=1 Tax=Undibacterium sp. Di26W TaxID=3413035 RepID=UPI003BF399A3